MYKHSQLAHTHKETTGHGENYLVFEVWYENVIRSLLVTEVTGLDETWGRV